MPISLKGSTSGSVVLDAAAVAGVNTITVPAQTGTMITTASSNALPVSAIATTGTPSASTYLAGNGAWQAVASNGQLIRAPQILTSGTSYTTPSNCTAIYVESLGGGGGGAGVGSTSASISSASGSAGAYTYKYFSVTPSTTYSYTIGASGTGGIGSGSSGGNGGNTTITIGATTVTATGGNGGVNTGVTGSQRYTSGVTATNGDFNPVSNFGFSAPGSVMGGSSMFGAGGIIVQNGNGNAATGYGAGGSGAQQGSSSGPNNGAAGSPGLIRIWEYT